MTVLLQLDSPDAASLDSATNTQELGYNLLIFPHPTVPRGFNTKRDPAPQNQQLFREPDGALPGPGPPCYMPATIFCFARTVDLGDDRVLQKLPVAGH